MPEEEIKEVDKKQLEPVGDVIIGKVNPQTLSQEEFQKSEELLFHGAESTFSFQRKIIAGSNSQTIGEGFYTTNERKNAELYSKIRRGFKGEPIITEVLPYQAKMLDLRAKENRLLNAFVPQDLAQGYLQYVKQLYSEKFPEGYTPDLTTRPLPAEATDYMNLSKYRSKLFELFREGKRVELRKLLSLTGESSISEYGGKFFTDYMLGKGYDGLIYNEGGDHPEQKHTTTYVFYNLEKIGTFETWHPEEK